LSAFSRKVEGEHSYFSSTPLFDSSNHEDVDGLIDFSDHSYRDLFTPVFDHNVDSIIVDISKPPVYDDISFDEVETLQAVEALQHELMVMSSPHCPEVGFTSDQEIAETPKASYHSSICIKDQYNTQITLPPPESHDPITHALEESYTISTLGRCKFSMFLTFACLSQSRECILLTSTRSVSHHHDKSTGCVLCAFTFFFSVDAFKLGVCLSSLLYLSCLLVCFIFLFANHAFTNMGQPMH